MAICVLLLLGIIYAAALDLSLAASVDTSASRVIGGCNAERREFPYMVSIHVPNPEQHTCGGSIISASWILTAAHCCEYGVCDHAKVYAGLLNQNESHPDVQKATVSEVINHPDFILTIYELEHDISLLKLTTPLTFTEAVKPIGLPSVNQTFPTGWLTGWGIYIRPNEFPVTLQRLEMRIVKNKECEEVLEGLKEHHQYPLLDSMVCSLPIGGGLEAACNADSGGPIANEGVVIGVVSWGPTCRWPKNNSPTVFTAVSKYLDFIRDHVKDLR